MTSSSNATGIQFDLTATRFMTGTAATLIPDVSMLNAIANALAELQDRPSKHQPDSLALSDRNLQDVAALLAKRATESSVAQSQPQSHEELCDYVGLVVTFWPAGS